MFKHYNPFRELSTTEAIRQELEQAKRMKLQHESNASMSRKLAEHYGETIERLNRYLAQEQRT